MGPVFCHHSMGDSRAPHGRGRSAVAPYRDWLCENLAPITWSCAATRLGRKLDNIRTRRIPRKLTPSSSSSSHVAGIPIPPPQYQTSKRDQSCQIGPPTPQKLVQDGSCQVGCPIMADNGASPDLSLLEVSMLPFLPIASYNSHWSAVWVDVVDQFGVIRGSRSSMPTPPEIETPANQFPPDETQEADGPPRLYPIPPYMHALLDRPPSSSPDSIPGGTSPRTSDVGSSLHPGPARHSGRLRHSGLVISMPARNESSGSAISPPPPIPPRVDGSPAIMCHEIVVR